MTVKHKIRRFLPAMAILALLGCSDDKTTAPSTPETTSPTVVSTKPAAGATNVPLATAISATFSEAMDKWSFNTVTFTIGGVTGTIQYFDSNKTVTFTPSGGLAYNQQYTAVLDTAIKDLTGNSLEAAHIWSFTTVPGEIMPLAVGNKWEMLVETIDTVSGHIDSALENIEIVRDSTIQNEKWYISKTGKAYINRSSGLWRRSLSGESYLFLKFPAIAGDFYPANPDSAETITVPSTSVLKGVPHGNHICYYYLSTVSDPAFKYRYYYKPNFGPVVHEKVTGTSSKVVQRKSLIRLTLL